MENKVVAIIPVRLSSTRFPEKHLKEVDGKKILDRVIEYTRKFDFIEKIVLATEDATLNSYQDKVDEIFMMPKNTARCGSERSYEYFKQNPQFDYYVSIPSDEPHIDYLEVNKAWPKLISKLEDESVGTFFTKFYNIEDVQDLRSCKIVSDEDNVLYFSRAVIPKSKSGEVSDIEAYKKHIGIHVFPQKLMKYLGSELWGEWKSPLADIESLEQNRFLQFGLAVQLQEIKHIGFGIDTPDQIQKLEQRLRENN